MGKIEFYQDVIREISRICNDTSGKEISWKLDKINEIVSRVRSTKTIEVWNDGEQTAKTPRNGTVGQFMGTLEDK